jgi:hypothetical protein
MNRHYRLFDENKILFHHNLEHYLCNSLQYIQNLPPSSPLSEAITEGKPNSMDSVFEHSFNEPSNIHITMIKFLIN